MFKILLVGGPKDGETRVVYEMHPYLNFPIAPETPILMAPEEVIMDMRYRIVRYRKESGCPVYYYVGPVYYYVDRLEEICLKC